MATPSQSLSLATLDAKDPAFISASAFHQACHALLERSQAADLPGWRLKILNQQGSSYLSISQDLALQASLLPSFSSGSDDEAQERGMSDDDDAEDDAAIHHQHGSSPYIEHNVMLSPTYCVPVLYFSLHNLPKRTGSDLKLVHDILVSKHLRATVKGVGVMGGISMSVGRLFARQERKGHQRLIDRDRTIR